MFPGPGIWIDWFNADTLLDQTAVAAGTTQATTQAKVEVLKFDQKVGQMLNTQVEFDQAKKAKALPDELPCKHWHEVNQRHGSYSRKQSSSRQDNGEHT